MSKVGLNPRNINIPSVIKENQTITGAFADLGDEIAVSEYTKLGIYIDLDINDSTGVVIQVLLRTKPGGDDYTHLTSSSYQWTLDDADGYYKIPDFDLNNLVNYVQIQVIATVPGASPGVIDKCEIVKAA